MTNEEKIRFKKILLITGIIFLCALIYVILSFAGLKIPCAFNKITGLKCPGCGNTRAVKALLQLNLHKAFSQNLLFPLEFGYIALVYAKSCYAYIKTGYILYKSPNAILDIIILILVISWGVIRNIIGC